MAWFYILKRHESEYKTLYKLKNNIRGVTAHRDFQSTTGLQTLLLKNDSNGSKATYTFYATASCKYASQKQVIIIVKY